MPNPASQASLWMCLTYILLRGFPGGSDKNLLAMQETQVRSWGWEDSLEKGMATHSSILAWRILRIEEPSGAQSMALQRIGHDLATNTYHIHIPFWVLLRCIFGIYVHVFVTYENSVLFYSLWFFIQCYCRSPVLLCVCLTHWSNCWKANYGVYPLVTARTTLTPHCCKSHYNKHSPAWPVMDLCENFFRWHMRILTGLCIATFISGMAAQVPSIIRSAWGSLTSHPYYRTWHDCCSVAKLCLTMQPHGLQCARLPCPSPWVCSNSCPLSQWCHPTTLPSVAPFSSCPQSFPASGSFPVNRLFTSGGQNIGASASASVLPMNI